MHLIGDQANECLINVLDPIVKKGILRDAEMSEGFSEGVGEQVVSKIANHISDQNKNAEAWALIVIAVVCVRKPWRSWTRESRRRKGPTKPNGRPDECKQGRP